MSWTSTFRRPLQKKRHKNLTRNPFKRCVEEIPEELQEDILDLYNDSTMKRDFRTHSLEGCWVLASSTYPKTGHKALHILLQFSSHLCEAGFSAMANIKTKARNKLDVEADLGCALYAITQNIPQLARTQQLQRLHWATIVHALRSCTGIYIFALFYSQYHILLLLFLC